MRFPSLNISTIPSPCITSASIELRDLMCQGSENIVAQCCIYNNSAPAWSESGTTTWSSVGTSYCGLILDSHTITYGNGNVSGDNQRYAFNILSLARAWSEGTQSPAKGVVFKANASFENQTGSDIKKWLKTFASYNRSAYQPSLKIVYEEWSENGNWGATSITAVGRYVSATKRIYSFVPASSGTYHVETEKPNGVSSQDTVVFLYDSSYHLLAKNDDKSSGTNYSKVSYTLTAGQTYHVIITKYPYNPTHDCYLAIYKNDSLLGSVSEYADFVKDFNKTGNHTDVYNCLAYALGITNDWVWDWGINEPTISQFNSFMNSRGYTNVSTYSSNCIIAYGTTSTSIAHFAKSVNGGVSAKMGQAERVSHPLGYNAYFQNGSYGIPRIYYVLNSSKSDISEYDPIKKWDKIDMYEDYWSNDNLWEQVYDVAINDLQSGIYSVSVVDNVPQEDVGLYPGEGVTKSSTGGATFSVACRVRSEPGGGYIYGFLTCAHAFSGDSNVYLNTGSGTNTLLGICYSFNQHFSGNADVAFIQTNSSVTSYNTVYANTTTLNSSYPTTYGIGTVVYKKGDGMSTVESGAVQCNNYSVTFNNVTITDLVKAGYYRAGGDSGGIVFTAPSGGYASPAGIHMGGLTTTSEHYGFFTKMYNALAALQSGPLTYSLY